MRTERGGHGGEGSRDMAAEPRPLSETERRDALLSAAEHVFLARGYVSTTMADIAQAAGMSKKTIYQIFDSKKALFDALMMDRLALLKVPAEDSGRPPDIVLRSVLLDISRCALAPKQIALTRLVLAEIASTPEVGDVMKARCVQVETTIQNWLAQQAERGVFAITDIPSAAAMLFGMAFGDFHWHLLLQLGDAPSEALLTARIERSVAVFMREFAGSRADTSPTHH
jgi:AcrR family transcriptional regulator